MSEKVSKEIKPLIILDITCIYVSQCDHLVLFHHAICQTKGLFFNNTKICHNCDR